MKKVEQPLFNSWTRSSLILASTALVFGCSGDPKDTPTADVETETPVITEISPPEVAEEPTSADSAETTIDAIADADSEAASDSIAQRADKIMEQSQASIQNVLESVKEGLTEIGQAAEESISNVFEDTSEVVDEKLDALSDTTETAIDQIKDDVASATDNLTEKLDQITAETADQIEEAKDAAADSLLSESDSTPQESPQSILDPEESVDTLEARPTATATDALETVKASPNLVRKVQQALTDAGFDAGAANGLFGPRTRDALSAYQQQNGLAEAGLTKETLRALDVDF